MQMPINFALALREDTSETGPDAISAIDKDLKRLGAGVVSSKLLWHLTSYTVSFAEGNRRLYCMLKTNIKKIAAQFIGYYNIYYL